MDILPDSLNLEGNWIKLKPMRIEDEEGLIDASKDGMLWKLGYTSVPENDKMKDYIKNALYECEKGKSIAFTIFDKSRGNIVGTTRFTGIDLANRRLEIGFTWYASEYQGTKVNKECKYLLLTYAFEKMCCMAVEFRTHHKNIQSQKALESIGAKLDGILRKHKIDRTGQIRNTMVYSILDIEWPIVKEKIEKRIHS